MDEEEEAVYEKCWRFLPLPFHIATTHTHTLFLAMNYSQVLEGRVYK